MDKYDYLKRPKQLIEEIQRSRDLIVTLQDQAKGLRTKASGDCVRTFEPDRMQNRIASYCEIQDKVERKQKELQEVRERIQTAINKLDNPTHQIILESRFLDCMSIEDIADCFGYATTQSVMSTIHRAVDNLPLSPYC